MTRAPEYLSRVPALIERFGATLDLPEGADLELLEEDDGTLSFEITGSLPDGTHPAVTRLVIREGFRRISPDLYERSRYEYELVDKARDFGRAFHLHFPKWFGRRFLVVVHEHCERPIGLVGCEHYAPEVSTMALDRDTTFTWYGHACVEVRTPGDKIILIDPWFGNPMSCGPRIPCSAATCCWSRSCQVRR